jgi:hypothetical protein
MSGQQQFFLFDDGTNTYTTSQIQYCQQELALGYYCYGMPLNFSLTDKSGMVHNFVNNLPNNMPQPQPPAPTGNTYYLQMQDNGIYAVDVVQTVQYYLQKGFYIFGFWMNFQLTDTNGVVYNLVNNLPPDSTPLPMPSPFSPPNPFVNPSSGNNYYYYIGGALILTGGLYWKY